jgi:tetratricopeptide (TPR) repeat protein
VRLGAQAQALLDAGDVEGYRSLFVVAAKLEDRNRRYHAQVVLLDLGLAVGGSWTSDRSTGLRMVVADAAVEALEIEPSEPVVLNAAALALYELGSLDAAGDLFGAARRLDPSLPHVRENLAAVDSRRRYSSRDVVHPALACLARRVTLVAGRARPASGLTLSLCMIVRDEEDMLGRCLTAAAPAVDEIVVVDTGSRDATIQIARSFGARVIEHEWTDSFSEPRNISFEAATGDWLISLDADQVLVSEDAEVLRELTGHTWREAFYLVETSHVGEAGDGYAVANHRLRVFRNRPEYRYKGRVHEQISHTLPLYAPGRVVQTSVRLQHYGYLKSVLDAKGKAQRNIKLLRVEVDENPTDASLRFTLGSEYLAAGDHEAGLPEFERAWALMVAEGGDANNRYVPPPLIDRMVRAMRLSGRLEDAASLAAEGLRRFPTFTDLVLAQANMAAVSGRYHEARELYRRCIELGDAPVHYRPLVGCGTYLPRIGLAGLEVMNGDHEAARQLLDWCIENHPGFSGVIRPYAALLLTVGVRPDEVVADIERRVYPLTSTARFMLGSALQGGGALEAAERQYRLAVANQPGSAEARVALAETLLWLGENADAAKHAAVVGDDPTWGGVARRIQLSGLICDRDLPAARQVLTGPPGGLSTVERDVFETWMALASGAPSPGALPVAAAGTLGGILETFLRNRSFDEFELLLPALEQSELPTQGRRELLGELYLRHGFLVSAAEEWMAVCAEQPDANALVGLARVAMIDNQPQDVIVFATAALELQPDNLVAAEILVRVESVACTVGEGEQAPSGPPAPRFRLSR